MYLERKGFLLVGGSVDGWGIFVMLRSSKRITKYIRSLATGAKVLA